jgi:hypothetical protein
MTDDIQTVHIDHAEAMEILSRQSQTIERLRAENKRVRSLLHWDIAEDEEGLIICDGNHEKRLYRQSTVDELRAEQSRLQSAVLALTGENAKLRAALKPFSDKATEIEVIYVNCLPPESHLAMGIEYRNLRAAKAALEECSNAK